VPLASVGAVLVATSTADVLVACRLKKRSCICGRPG
jgi:hypothetical protein